MAEACIMCHEFKSGLPVEDTSVLRALRRLKSDFAPVQILWGKPSGNTLVVCPPCLAAHQKRRRAYEGKVLLHAVITAALLAFLILLPLISGTFQLGSILVGILLGALLMALPLMDYVPPLSATAQATASAMLAAAKTAAPAEKRGLFGFGAPSARPQVSEASGQSASQFSSFTPGESPSEAGAFEYSKGREAKSGQRHPAASRPSASRPRHPVSHKHSKSKPARRRR
ncbi:MAG: hypothetical protein M1530_03085 [Candidatus Marsarchaeota archaeon]|nr:hypothetical protein [Candidatus Marsarchaeota archaeon]